MIEIILSYLVVLVALVAVSTPLWVGYVKSAEKSETDRLDSYHACALRVDSNAMGQLIIPCVSVRLLLHDDPLEGTALLDKVHG